MVLLQRITIVGQMDCEDFQKCYEAASYLNAEYKEEYKVTVERILPYQYAALRDELIATKRLSEEPHSVIAIPEAGPCEAADVFLKRISATTGFQLFDVPVDDVNSYAKLAQKAYKANLRERGNMYCWMLVSIDGIIQGRILYELYAKTLPRTSENFMHLCKGDQQPVVLPTGETVTRHYKDSTFFRIVKGGWVQGGDVLAPHGGNGGYSCYGRYFPDESFALKHDQKGILGMCNDGEHTNASAFYITMGRQSWMNGKYVAFGRVVDGFHIVQKIHALATRHNESPTVPVLINECGVIDVYE